MPFRRVIAGGMALAGLWAGPVAAQQADVIRGRVTSDDGKPIEHASVVATSIPNNVKKTADTDRNGRYALVFPSGDGDYWISVSAIGYAPRRFELKRIADEAVLMGDVKLAGSIARLDEITVRAERLRPGRNEFGDPTGAEKSVSQAGVDPGIAGNLAQMAASVPGVQLIPGADGNPDQYSVFGLGGDQNGASVNGLGFGGTDIPRDAATRSSLATTPWDVSRGGFSGGQLNLNTQSGSNFSARGLSSLLNAPMLQWTDRAGRALGAEYRSASLGGAVSGPLSLNKSFYNAGYQLDRRTSGVSNLEVANPFALALAGVSPDSVVRLRDILADAGVPVTISSLPRSRTSDRGLVMAAFDVSPPTSTTGQSLNVTMIGSFQRLNSPLAQVTALPTNDVRSTSWFAGLQARHTNYVGFGALSETSFGISRQYTATDPYLALPSGAVRVSSDLADGGTAVTGLTFGGSQAQNTTDKSWTVGGQNQLSWFTADNRHRIKLSSALRYERFDQDMSTDRLGRFLYNSLADLEANQPVAFSRLLSPRVRGGGQLVGSLALGDFFRPASDLQIQYGVRLDANRFLNGPAANPAVRDAFGVSNTSLPNRVYLSPRVGFSWTYGHAAQIAVGSGFVRGPRAVVRGGVGVFQNTPGTRTVGAALSNTGLPDANQQLTCVGAAVPVPDWRAYAADLDAIPTRCADGGGGTVFGSTVPSVTLFDPGYAAPRSVRGNLSWSGAVLGNRMAASVDATVSWNRNQPGFVDLNFGPAARFTLDNEAGRPVYVPAATIVPATGALSAQNGRLMAGFGPVVQQRSDLSSLSKQVTIGLSPTTFSGKYAWSLSYTLSSTRDALRGFASTAGDPRLIERARSYFDARHQISYSLSYNFFDWVPVSLSGSFRSGRPFTPLVAGDLNGDGYLNDRAFVFDPGARGVDPPLSAAMQSLRAAGSPAGRACLLRQIGQLAARNSCTGPWTSTSTLTIGVNPLKLGLPQRLNFSLYVNNAYGAADLLLHGDKKRRGWGQSALPDASLLYIRGFDPLTRTFRYDVNPRFGSTSLSQTANRNPVVVTAVVRFDIGAPRERQLLTQALDRGRGREGSRSTDQDFRAMGVALIPPNPVGLLLQQADTLELSRLQADSLAGINRRYAMAYDKIWTPVGKYLSGLPERYDRAQAYQSYRKAREVTVDLLIAMAPTIRALLTPAQIRMLPPLVATSLDARYLSAVRSSTAGGASMGLLGMLAQMGWMGGSIDPNASSVMIHR